jgi:hypothetical protein
MRTEITVAGLEDPVECENSDGEVSVIHDGAIAWVIVENVDGREIARVPVELVQAVVHFDDSETASEEDE